MGSIETAIALTDRISAPLYNICTAVSAVIGGFESMQYASGTAFDSSVFEGANERLTMAYEQIDAIANNTGTATRKQEEYNQKVGAGAAAADNLVGKITRVVGAYVGISTVKNVLGLSDELAQATARLDMMNDGMQTTAELSDMIYQSAQRSRSSYLETAESVAKLGNNARDAFASTGEVVEFAELVNKQFVIAGASASESSNAFLQLTQALGSGTLRGDELNSIFEQAPNLIQSVADYMDIPIGQIREMASEGQITADIVKNAMFAAEDEINAKFEKMPMTWGQLWTSFSNQAERTFQPFFNRLSEVANSEQMQTCIAGVMNALSGVAMVAANVIDILATGGAFIVDNWDFIAPIILGVAAAIAVYEIATKGAALAAQVAEIAQKAWTSAQAAFNAVMALNPISLIIITIIGLIAVIYIVIAAINRTPGTTISATGVIMGVLNAFKQYFENIFILIGNVVIDFVNFFYNVFNDPVAAVKVLFLDMATSVIGYMLKIGEAIETIINKIPGVQVDITTGVENVLNAVKAASEKVKEESDWREYLSHDNYGSYEEAYNIGYEWGQGAENQVKDFLDKMGDAGSYNTGGAAENLNNIANDTANISDSLDVSEEDLKYLRDIAEQDAINRFTTAEISVNMSGMQNTVNNTNDLDGIVDGLTTRVMEAMEIIREGV